jgi:hypothetical protein
MNQKQEKILALCLHFVPVVLCCEPSSPAATLESRKDRNDRKHLYDKGLKPPLWKQWNFAGQTPTHHEDNYLCIMPRLQLEKE